MRERVRRVQFVGMRSERGAGVVEVALVLPVLMCLILGLVSGGIAYQRKISLTDAVREGARYGATLDAGTINTTTGVFTTTEYNNWRDKVVGRVVELSGGELQPSDVCAALVKNDSTDACGVKNPTGTTGIHIAKVSASRNSTLEAFFFSRQLTLRAATAARFEREQA